MLFIKMQPTASPASSAQIINLWLNTARVLQIMLILLTVGLFIASIPFNYEQRSLVCNEEPCPTRMLTQESERVLRQAGLSVDAFVKGTIALDILVAAAYTTSAMVILIRKPKDQQTLFVAMMLVTFGLGAFTGEISGLGEVVPLLGWLTKTIAFIGSGSIIAFILTFPTGRLQPRWTIIILAGCLILQIPRYYFPNSSLDLQYTNAALYNILFTLGAVSSLLTLLYRYRQGSSPVARQQMKWVVYGLMIGLGGYLAVRWVIVNLPDLYGRDLPLAFGLLVLSVLLMLLLPLSIAVAVLRYRLWDINPIINRTLVYGALSASTVAVYVLVVGLFSSFIHNVRSSYLIAFLATGLITILFEPLRRRLQRSVNRLMYGERDDPATVLSRLNQRIEMALAPDAVLPLIVETVAQALRLPYAAIIVDSLQGEARVTGETGQPPAELVHFPLIYQTERVGELRLAPRAPGEAFSPADLKLLNIITQQAGAAVHMVKLNAELRQLNDDLQRSRERLVVAREEERRRLRRDLHDGVGPTLASLSHRLGTAADLVASDPQTSIALLKELKGQVKGTVAEIRRLVYALRPPVLDEFGLVSAIREHIAPYSVPSGIKIDFEVTEPLPALPAAVEVAAYRIVLEAFTNIIKHAHACQCHIRIQMEEGALVLEVSDDGSGVPETVVSGVGSISMRERAEELGGECRIERLTRGGTSVRARLPAAELRSFERLNNDNQSVDRR